MFSADSPQKFTEKGLGWVPDSPDERDYDLYQEITKQYSGDSKNSLKRVHEVLKNIEGLPFQAKQAVALLEEDFEQFNFVKVNTYQVLSEKKEDSRVVLLKFLMVYFYQHMVKKSKSQHIATQEIQASTQAIQAMKEKLVEWAQSTTDKNEVKGRFTHFDIIRESQLIESLWDNQETVQSKLRIFNNDFLGFLIHPERYWAWLNNKEYDFILSALVYGFQTWVNSYIYNINTKLGERSKTQDDHGIHVDGVVGIQTYTWLREWLKVDPLEEERLSGDKPNSGESDSNSSPSKGAKSLTQAVFPRVPFSTSLPPEMLRVVFELLLENGSREKNLKNEDKSNFSKEELGLRVEKLARENFFEIEPILLVITLIAGPVGSYPKTLRTALKIATKVFMSLFIKESEQRIDKKSEIDFMAGASQDSKRKPPIYSLGQTIQLPDRDFIALEEEQKNLVRLKELSKDSVALSVQRIKEYFKETVRRDLLAFKALVQKKAEVEEEEGKKTNCEDSERFLIAQNFKGKLKELSDSASFLGQIYEVLAFLDSNSVVKGDDGNLEDASKDSEDASNLIRKIRNLNKKSEELKGDPAAWFTEPTGLNEFLTAFDELTDFLNKLNFQKPKATKGNSRFKDLVTLELTNEHSGSVPISHLSGQRTSASDRLAVNSSGSPSKNEINQRLFPSYLVPGGADLLKNRKVAKSRFESVEGKGGKQKPDIEIRTYTYLPQIVDLSFWCSPIYDQGPLQSCSAQAGAALVEYFARRYSGGNKDISRRFLYKIARNLMGRTGDSGSSLRETIKAMALFGVPPETYWPYDTTNFDEEPTPFCYSFAQNYQALNYFRIDQANVVGDELLTRIKIALAAGFPCTFGFTLHESIHDPFNIKRGYIPYPGKSNCSLSKPDMPVGGHAALAVGYHDFKNIMKSNNPQEVSEGAFLIRNSWGTNWGLNGYGWLPYDYLLQGLTSDWWSLIKLEWLESGKLGLGGARNFGGSTGQVG